MRKLADHVKCTGCSACQQICPHACISMEPDSEGFLYPETDEGKCTRCGLCEKVCPLLNKDKQPAEPLKTLGGYITDQSILMSSSSGGFFSAFAKQTFRNKGVVFGVRYDEALNVIHDSCYDMEHLAAFRGSKYVQSRLGDTFTEVRRHLDAGREVLFTGTPCQVLGLKSFLRKAYDNLKTIDLICHGVPSPLVFDRYKAAFSKPVTAVSFRDKTHGWRSYDVSVSFRDGSVSRGPFAENAFMKLFLQNMISRKSCADCPAKSGKSGSDVTIGDLWGSDHLLPGVPSRNGLSLVVANTPKGLEMVDTMQDVELFKVDYCSAARFNSAIACSSQAHVNRDFLFKTLRLFPYDTAFSLSTGGRLHHRIIRKMFRMMPTCLQAVKPSSSGMFFIYSFL